jgi:hypothetical protein
MKLKHFSIFACAIFACYSCNTEFDSLQLSHSSLSMNYEDQQPLQVINESGNIEWSTENDFHATVNQNGMVTAGHVGSTNIVAQKGKQKGKCSVTVKPKYALYDTPYMNWGATMTQVKVDLGTPDQEQAKALVYKMNSAGDILAIYSFTDGKLTSSGVLLHIKYGTTLGNYLVERYQPIGYENDKYYFINAMNLDQASLGIMLMSTTVSGSSAYSVVYAPYSPSANAPIHRQVKQKDIFKLSEELALKFNN